MDIETFGKHRKTQIPVLLDMTFGSHDQLSCCHPSRKGAITKSYKYGCHHSIIQHGDLTGKSNTIKFGSVLNLSILSNILDGSHYQKL